MRHRLSHQDTALVRAFPGAPVRWFAFALWLLAAVSGCTGSVDIPGGAPDGGHRNNDAVDGVLAPPNGGPPDAATSAPAPCQPGTTSCLRNIVTGCANGGTVFVVTVCADSEECVSGQCVPAGATACTLDVDCLAAGLAHHHCAGGFCVPPQGASDAGPGENPGNGGDAATNGGGSGVHDGGGDTHDADVEDAGEITDSGPAIPPDAGVAPGAGAPDGAVIPDAGIADAGYCERITEACDACRVRTAECDPAHNQLPFGACEGPMPNACGGCSELPFTPGGACGDCGTWVCDGSDKVKCEDPGMRQCTDFASCATVSQCEECAPAPAEVCDGKDNDCSPANNEEGRAVDCPAGQICSAGACCASECPSLGFAECVSGTQARVCGNSDADICLEWNNIACDAASVCENGKCQCVPNDAAACQGRECGEAINNCGATVNCGTCTAPESCDPTGQCLCKPDCDSKTCGPDGCGATCGTCPAPFKCLDSHCECVPDCAGKACGSDGCGGSCGSCTGQTVCQGNQCVCVPQCSGKECGSDGCGGSCGSCPNGSCNGSGKCECPTCGYGKSCKSDLGCANWAYCSGGICQCRGGYYGYSSNGHCYKGYANTYDWSTAQSRCGNPSYNGHGVAAGHLAVITSSGERSFIEGLWSSGEWWIGYSDMSSEGAWVWVTGEGTSYTAWASGEPNNNGNEDCAVHRDGGDWLDISCTWTRYYTCEVP